MQVEVIVLTILSVATLLGVVLGFASENRDKRKESTDDAIQMSVAQKDIFANKEKVKNNEEKLEELRHDVQWQRDQIIKHDVSLEQAQKNIQRIEKELEDIERKVKG